MLTSGEERLRGEIEDLRSKLVEVRLDLGYTAGCLVELYGIIWRLLPQNRHRAEEADAGLDEYRKRLATLLDHLAEGARNG